MLELKQNKWNQVVIPTSDAVSGKGVQDLINVILEVKKFKYVILDDMEGMAQEYLMRIIRNLQYTPIRLKDLASILQNIERFESGSFYLFEEYPKNWDDADHYFDSYLVNQTDSTIRVMNENYIYLYTPFKSIVEIIKKNYKIEDVKTDYLENLDYPY